jgi:hypothetical protein
MPRSSSVERARTAVALLSASVALSAPSAMGCHAACDPAIEANTPEVFSAGLTMDGAYQSGPWVGPHLAFPGGKRWNLEHHLGAAPRHVAVYLAFNADTRELAPCAGNTCVFCVDDQYVWLRNDTCADFWVRVEADAADPAVVTPRCEAALSGSEEPSDASRAGASDAIAADAAVTETATADEGDVDTDAGVVVPPP